MRTFLGLVVIAFGVVAAWRATAPPARCPDCGQIHDPKDY